MTEKITRFSGVLKRNAPAAAEPEPAPVVPVSIVSPPAATNQKTRRPPGKKTDPNYAQVTVYLRKEVHHTARKILFDDGRQFSDLVDELVSRWIADCQTSRPP